MGLKWKLAIVMLVLSCLATPLFAQSDRGAITGTVKDPSMAVIPGVQVKATNLGTNAVTATTTNGQGLYRLNNLPVGTYAIQFTRSGFKTVYRGNIILLIGQVAEVDATLPVGSESVTVQVNSAPPILQTQSAAVSTYLNSQAVNELPLNVQGSRNLSNFIFAYVPGAEGSDYDSHIDGSMAMTKEVLIDGTSATSQLGGYISESQPPMSAVQEFKADTAGISAEGARTGGGVFQYELKSGTNNIHGELFGFMHNTGLDALSASNHLAAINDPANADAYLRKQDSLSDWGGGFGGPIIKNKLFYYAAFERYMQAMWSLGPLSRTVPTDAMMGLDANGNTLAYADLSSALTTSNQLGTDPCNNPIYEGAIFNPSTGCVFANNQIPTSLISGTTAKILQLYHQYYKPESSLTANDAGPAYQPDPWFHNTQSSIKIDYNLSNRQHLAGSFYWDDYPRINADQGGVWSPTAQYGGPMANSYWHNTTAPGARLSDAITISPNIVNTIYATFSRFRNPSIAVSQAGGWDKSLGITDGAGNFPLIVFSSGMYTNGGNYHNGWDFSSMGSQFNDFYAANTFLYSDQLVWNHGRNNMKFGVEFRAMQFNSHPDTGTFNNITFDPTSTAGPWWNYNGYNMLGNAFGSFLLGDVYLATEMPADPQYGRRKAFAWYASDDIHVNARTTVNLSLRWDFNSPYKEKYGHWSSFSLNEMNPVTGALGRYDYLTSGSQSFEKRQDYYNYSPHVGVAYKITNRTVARGAFGVYYTPLSLNTWGGIPYQQTGNPGFYQHSSESNFNWDSGYQPTLSQVKTPDYTQWGVVHIDPRALTPGNVQQYNLGVQQQLDKYTVLDVNWIQSHSYHLQSGTLLTNQPTVANMQNYVLNGQFPASYNGYWGYQGTGPGWQGITPYPQVAVSYGPLFSVGPPLGNSDYKGLQFSVSRRAAHGLSMMASYTWSRTHGDVNTAFEELWWTGSLQNIYDLKNEAKDIASFDQTHVVKGYIIYQLPIGRGMWLLPNANKLTDALVGGWTLAGDFHYNTGTPMSIHSTNSYPGFNSVYINLVPGCSLTNSGQRKLYGQYLDRDCFANPTYGQLGTAGNFQSQLRNPGLATEDLSAHKSVAFGPAGRYKFTFRAAFFNVFNRHQLAGPDTNLNDPTFGKIINYGGLGGRIGQLGARFTF
jgi:hypothetical protein